MIEYPDCSLRGRMIREIWDSDAFMTYRMAKQAVEDLIEFVPEIKELIERDESREL